MLVLQHIQSCLKHIISVVSFQSLLFFYVPRHKMFNRGVRTEDARPVPQKGFYLSKKRLKLSTTQTNIQIKSQREQVTWPLKHCQLHIS